MSQFQYHQFFKDEISNIKDEGRYRVFAEILRQAGDYPDGLERDPNTGEMKGVTVWCSNDYLGMAQHPHVLKAMHETIYEVGAGAGGTRNIAGNSPLHADLEKELSELHGKDATILFPCGWLANFTTLSALAAGLPDCHIYSDEKNHASMIEGIRHNKVEKTIFRHNDLEHLEQLLKQSKPSQTKIIAFESVYSMDGDIAPINELCELAKKYNALTYLDEVHAVGLYGPHGGGISERDNVAHKVDIINGTLAKGYGVQGGYISSSKECIDYIRSTGSGFIFTTALAPVLVSASLASIKHLKRSHVEREGMHRQAQRLKQALRDAGLPLLENDSHIVPVLVGDPIKCKQITDLLLTKHNIYVQPINYPTVPKGTERLRLTPTPNHSDEHIKKLVRSLLEVWQEVGLKQNKHAA